MTIPVFRTPYNDDYVDNGLDCSKEPLLTVQDEIDNCDINRIVERYEKTGLLPVMQKAAVFGDFSSPVDFQQAQNIYIEAEKAFMSLPAEMRKKFDNSALQFLEFVDDPKNADELIKMGLREPPVEKPEASPTTETAQAAPAD